MPLLDTTSTRACSAIRHPRSRRSVLLSSVFLGVGAGTIGATAFANGATIGGVDCPTCVHSGKISVAGVSSDVDITVDTAPIGASGAPVTGVGVYAYSTEDMSVTATQDITSTDRAIWLDSNSVTPGEGSISVISSGALTSTLLTGVEILEPYAPVLLDGQQTGTIAGAIDGIAIFGYLPGGTQEIRGFESIVGGKHAIYVHSLGADVSLQDIGQIGDASTAVDGIYVDADEAPGGSIDIGGSSPIGSVQGGDDGMELYTSGDGTITVNVGDVTGADWGIYAIGADGNAEITVTGAAEGTDDVGIETRTTTGNVTIDANDVTGGTWGIYTRASTGDNDITVSGDVNAGSAIAIDAITGTGNITIDGSGTATATAGDVGIWAGTMDGGSVTVQNFDTISSVDTGLFTYSSGGDISITGVGTGGGITSTELDGIFADGEAADGNVTITGNGPITAADDGIEAYSFGTGTMTIGADSDISAIDFGIYSRSVDGDTSLHVAEGVTVSATSTSGIDATASGAGATTIDIAADAVVEGGAFGLVTGTLATVENAGTIRTIGDTGAANDAGTGIALWSWTGLTEFNNSGDVLGQVHSDVDGVTFNNTADGEWYAGTGVHEFQGAADAVNNSGTIFIRDGFTHLDGLETFMTTSGGRIDMSYNPVATDTLQVLNFSTQSGASLSFDFDAQASNNAGLGYDSSDDGLGTADTIVVAGTAAPAAGSLVAVNHVNGDPAGLAGSVSLVYTGVDIDAPKPGETVVSSDLYQFEKPGKFAATAYYLVDDGNGGLYYQWAPNLTSATLGAYGGGDLGGGSKTDASNIAGATSGFAGLGGLGGFDGGATGAIADSAASSVRRGTADQTCQNGRASRAWTAIDGNSVSGRGFDASNGSFTLGYEHDLGELFDQGCGRLVGGVFGTLGKADMTWDTGTSKSSNEAAGIYLRYASTNGFYASGLAAISHVDTDMSNAVFGSTATQKSVGYAGVATLGYVMPVSAAGSIDWRTSLSYGVVNGDPFVDSAGIQIDDTESRLTTAGLSATYWHQFDDTTSGFVKAGVNWTEADREVTAFGVKVAGTSKSTVGTLAMGVSTAMSDAARFDVSVRGAFADGMSSIGGSIGFEFNF